MKDICIVYSKDNKSLIKKLTTKLESNGISCNVGQRNFKQNNKEELSAAVVDSKVLLLIIDSKSASNKEQIDALEQALENDISVIPYVISKIESDLYSEHFFYSFSWIDAYEDSFDDAYEVLIDAYEDISGEDTANKKIKKKSANNTNNLLNNKPLMIAAAVVILLSVSYFVYNYFKNEKESQLLVGQWYMVDYQDNMRRSKSDSLLFMTQTIPAIKRNALLIFNDDNSFERRGFTPEPQIGTWLFNADKSTLRLKPYGATAATDELKLTNVSKTSFTIVAEELLEDSVKEANGKYRHITNRSVTKIRFAKKR